MSTNATADNFYYGVRAYYSNTWNCGINVWKTMYDADDLVVTN